jgi:hypothetical protein
MFVSSHAAVSFGESSARRLLSQRPPTAGEWSSPGEPIHPGEYGTGRIGSDRELTLIRAAPRGQKTRVRIHMRLRRNESSEMLHFGHSERASNAAAAPGDPWPG